MIAFLSLAYPGKPEAPPRASCLGRGGRALSTTYPQLGKLLCARGNVWVCESWRVWGKHNEVQLATAALHPALVEQIGPHRIADMYILSHLLSRWKGHYIRWLKF